MLTDVEAEIFLYHTLEILQQCTLMFICFFECWMVVFFYCVVVSYTSALALVFLAVFLTKIQPDPLLLGFQDLDTYPL